VRSVAQAGGIVFRGAARRKGGVSVLLVSSKKERGNWIFPKGHVEVGETAAEAALRETQEEAGVDGDLLGEVGTLEFDWGGRRYRVDYFLIRATGETDQTDGRKKTWLPFEDAVEKLTYPDLQRLLRKAHPRMVG
jgi:8-oxo-dGTP pyrophosphatase MutT (NUDIX family)